MMIVVVFVFVDDKLVHEMATVIVGRMFDVAVPALTVFRLISWHVRVLDPARTRTCQGKLRRNTRPRSSAKDCFFDVVVFDFLKV